MTENRKNKSIDTDNRFIDTLSKIDVKYIEEITDASVQPIFVTASPKKAKLTKFILPAAAALTVTASAITGMVLMSGNPTVTGGADITANGVNYSSEVPLQTETAVQSESSVNNTEVTSDSTVCKYHEEIAKRFEETNAHPEIYSIDKWLADYDEDRILNFEGYYEGQIELDGTIFIPEDNCADLYKKGDIVFCPFTHAGDFPWLIKLENNDQYDVMTGGRLPECIFLTCGNVENFPENMFEDLGIEIGKEVEAHVTLASIRLIFSETGTPIAECEISSINRL